MRISAPFLNTSTIFSLSKRDNTNKRPKVAKPLTNQTTMALLKAILYTLFNITVYTHYSPHTTFTTFTETQESSEWIHTLHSTFVHRHRANTINFTWHLLTISSQCLSITAPVTAHDISAHVWLVSGAQTKPIYSLIPSELNSACVDLYLDWRGKK